MKTSLRHRLLLAIGFVISTGLAHAHPGHDDGHELTWDFRHLAQHPLATMGCMVVLGIAVGLIVKLVQSRAPTTVVAQRRKRG